MERSETASKNTHLNRANQATDFHHRLVQENLGTKIISNASHPFRSAFHCGTGVSPMLPRTPAQIFFFHCKNHFPPYQRDETTPYHRALLVLAPPPLVLQRERQRASAHH